MRLHDAHHRSGTARGHSAGLSEVDEVLEIHTVTGRGDLLVKIVAATNDNLHATLQRIAAIDSVRRTETLLALHSALVRNVAHLVAAGIRR